MKQTLSFLHSKLDAELKSIAKKVASFRPSTGRSDYNIQYRFSIYELECEVYEITFPTLTYQGEVGEEKIRLVIPANGKVYVEGAGGLFEVGISVEELKSEKYYVFYSASSYTGTGAPQFIEKDDTAYGMEISIP